MTMTSGCLLATTTGTLSAVDFSDGLPSTTAVLSGPAIDGQTWQSRGLLVLNLPTRAPAFCEIVWLVRFRADERCTDGTGAASGQRDRTRSRPPQRRCRPRRRG